MNSPRSASFNREAENLHQRVAQLVSRAHLVHYSDGDDLLIIGLAPPCGAPARLHPDGAFEPCAECGRTSESLWGLIQELHAETHDPSGPDADLERRLASGPPVVGVTAIVRSALIELQMSPSREAVCAYLERLAKEVFQLDSLGQKQARFDAIEHLQAIGVAPEQARALVGAAFERSTVSASKTLQGKSLALTDPEPWPDPVGLNSLLDDVVATVRRYVILEEHSTDAVALWVALTYALDHAPVAVRLVITSPTRECGKTRLLTVLSGLARRALAASSVSPAVLFRVIEQHAPTLLLDEFDNARLGDNDELRALLNSGHTRGTAHVLRNVGEEHEPRQFSTWCAVAFAAIGELPDTVASRGIIIRLQRRRRDEAVAPLRERRLEAELEPLRRKLARWAADCGHLLATGDPELPPALDGRPADNWGVLVGIADLAGSAWPERARRAALAVVGAAHAEEPARIVLLGDIRDLFEERRADRLASDDIVRALAAMENRPWPSLSHGKAITTQGVARLLKPFEGIEPRTLRLDDGRRLKGYHREQFEDAWGRYLPLQAVASGQRDNAMRTRPGYDLEAVTPSATIDDRAVTDGADSAAGGTEGVTHEIERVTVHVTDRSVTEAVLDEPCHGVTDRQLGEGTSLSPYAEMPELITSTYAEAVRELLERHGWDPIVATALALPAEPASDTGSTAKPSRPPMPEQATPVGVRLDTGADPQAAT